MLTRNAGIEVEHSFRRWLIGAVKFNYGHDDYVGSARKDDRYSIAGALTYKLNRMAQVKGEIRQEWLRSTVPGVDYDALGVPARHALHASIKPDQSPLQQLALRNAGAMSSRASA